MTEGYIVFPYEGEIFQTYYRVVGDLENRTRPPIIIIHGGPGLSHDYVLPHADLALQSYPVVLYDQLGNGRSTHLPHKPLTWWSIDLFLEELTNLLAHFGIQDEYHLLGHSWGGIMGAEFVVRRRPQGLKRLIIANSPAAIDLWDKSFSELLQAFPQSVRDRVARDPDEDRRAFYDAMMEIYAVHGCRLQPFPDEFVTTVKYLWGDEADRSVDKANLLAGWTIVDRLQAIYVPTLIINARHDIAQDYVVKAYVENIPQVEWVKFQNSSHTPCWEERAEYMQVVGDFLGGVEVDKTV